MQLWVLVHMYQLALKVRGRRGGRHRQECGGVAEAGWSAALGAGGAGQWESRGMGEAGAGMCVVRVRCRRGLACSFAC